MESVKSPVKILNVTESMAIKPKATQRFAKPAVLSLACMNKTGKGVGADDVPKCKEDTRWTEIVGRKRGR